ncbi:hypothetical protein [Methylobacterium iners]|uniref:Uncharacterized protein n=1 Tax=Methylobacterium iners TaxID=418707 RepID=A0ABQ4RV07_9HYPH|nr:hypothetical protein [Methylobacterium iners]GJD93988.1 hypothetical protein OCOJLMKI_1186 [Methylobacterium iners]
MWALVKPFLLGLIAFWISPYWKLAKKQSKPGVLSETMGELFLLACLIFALYNLYRLTSFGLVYSIAGDDAGWIAFDEHPVAFVFFAVFYSLPFLIPFLILVSRFLWKDRMSRTEFKAISDKFRP